MLETVLIVLAVLVAIPALCIFGFSGAFTFAARWVARSEAREPYGN